MARHKGPQKRLKAFSALLGVLALLIMGAVSFTAPAAASGNNGSIKIHEAGTPSGTESNDPKVCSFNIEGYGFDVGQSGYIVFSVQGGDGPTGTPAGPFAFGPTDSDGYYATQYFSLDNGHYKATLYGKFGDGGINYEDELAKSKVFKVECQSQVTIPTQNTVDPCNPEGVTNNVAWAASLPTDTDEIDWSESNGGATRTAALKGDREWTDGTTANKVFNLPADSGVECEDEVEDENDGLCHATGNGGYVLIENISSAGIFNGHYDEDGEGPEHPGDHQNNADIIPPFTYNGQEYPGQNWDAEGQALFENGCVVEDEVEPEGNLNVSSTCESITFGSSGVKPEDATVTYKLDGVTKTAGTYPVAPGSHTVELFVNSEKVDTETVVVEECPDVIQIPASAQQLDPCGPANASWVVPADVPGLLDWELLENGHLIVTIVAANTEFPDGTTSHDYGLPTESGDDCLGPPPSLNPSGSISVGCKGNGEAVANNSKSTVPVGFEVVVNGHATLYSVGAGKVRTISFSGAKPGSVVVLQDGEATELDSARVPQKCGGNPPHNPPNNPPEHPTNPPHAGATSADGFGLGGLLGIGSMAVLFAAGLLMLVSRRRVGVEG